MVVKRLQLQLLWLVIREMDLLVDAKAKSQRKDIVEIEKIDIMYIVARSIMC